MALFPAAQAKHLSIHLTLPNEVFFLFLVFAFFKKKKQKNWDTVKSTQSYTLFAITQSTHFLKL